MVVLFQWILLLCYFSPVQENPTVPAIRFEIVNAGITVDGHFEKSTHSIRFDPKQLSTSTLEGKATVATLRTGIALRDRHLLGRQYFRADAYPEITMRAKRIINQGKDTYRGVFDITIKDIVKEVEVPFRIEKQGQRTHYKARFTLNRLDFGLGEKSLILADEVTVIVNVVEGLN
jgi:polyisoprenoid-binding protein YceI